MDTCPHGSRIDVAPGRIVVFLDPCLACQALLDDLGVESSIVPVVDYAAA